MIVFPLVDVDAPAGGVRVIYGMVDALNAAGIDAAVWHAGDGFRASWFDHSTRIVTGTTYELSKGDLLVWSELGGARYHHLNPGARVVMLNQAPSYTFDGFDARTTDPSPYPGWPNAEAVIVTSAAIERFLSGLIRERLPIYRVPVVVDEAMFRSEPKERVIALMPFRRPTDAVAVRHLVLRDPALPAGWRFDVIVDADAQAVARRLGRSALFVSLAQHEGFGLTSAEAMAAGCHVIGFHGEGGREYLLPDLATCVEDPDVVTLAERVVAGAIEFEQDRHAYDTRSRAARQFIAAHYSRELFDDRVVSAFRRLIESGAGQVVPIMARHPQWQSSSSGLASSAKGIAGRVIEQLTPPPVPQRRHPTGTSARHDQVSVIIPHYGDPADARAAVGAITSADVGIDLQVIVVDDASPTPYPKDDRVEVVRLPQNVGFGGAVNAGAARAEHPWLLILNSDVLLDAAALRSLVEESAALQPAITSPLLTEDSGRISSTANLFASPWQALYGFHGLRRWLERGRLNRHIGLDTDCREGEIRRTDWLLGACLLMRTDDFRRVGGFDERFHMYAEEVDLQYRLRELGVDAWFVGDVVARHAGGGSTPSEHRSAWMHRSHFLYALKRGYGRRALAASRVTSALNLAYDGLKQVLGKDVDAMASWRHDMTGTTTAWREARRRFRLPTKPGW